MDTFTIVIPTNKQTDEIDHNIKSLIIQCIDGDDIVLINYNNFHLSYRSEKKISYKQISLNRSDALDMYFKRYCNQDNIVIINPHVKIKKDFLSNLRRDFDNKKIGTCRIDTIKNGSVVIDKRIGSSINGDMFTNDVLIFDRSITGVPGKKSVIDFCNDYGDLELYKNIKVYFNDTIRSNNITLIIPSRNTTLRPIISKLISKNDTIHYFNIGKRNIVYYLNKFILSSPNDTILFINPETSIFDESVLEDVRLHKGINVYDTNTTYNIKKITDDCIVSFDKSLYKSTSHIQTNNTIDIQKFILGSNEVRYKTFNHNQISDYTPITRRGGDKYSIIIPFMYNGDRWDIFNASIQCLYEHTKDYENIEIVVHETAPTRFIDQKFINKYNIVYGYSKWDNHFHRGWSLNVAARHLASGDIFTFFDADLLINKTWVMELLKCTKGDIKIGWGKMKNLTRSSTLYYLNTGQIYNDLERTRLPSSHGAGGGINIISKDIFYKIKGWPEEFTSYGGEDNVYNFKLHSLGYTKKDYK